jgi:WD40 repeat protein
MSDDGSLCITGGYDTKVVIWDLTNKMPKLVLKAHTNWVNDVDITKDNKWICSVGKVKNKILIFFFYFNLLINFVY